MEISKHVVYLQPRCSTRCFARFREIPATVSAWLGLLRCPFLLHRHAFSRPALTTMLGEAALRAYNLRPLLLWPRDAHGLY